MTEAIDLRQWEEVDWHHHKILVEEIVDDANDFTLTKIEIIEKAVERLQKQVFALENSIYGLRGNRCNEITEEDKSERSVVDSLTNIPNELNDLSIRLLDLGPELRKALFVREEVAGSNNADDDLPL